MSAQDTDVTTETAVDAEHSDTMVAAIGRNPIRLTVAGQVNVGKTSWMRTMFADQKFGKVADRPGVTMSFLPKKLKMGDVTYLKWYDAPGLTCGGKILDAVRAVASDGHLPRADDLQQVLENMDQYKEIKWDLKILQRCQKCDVILYLVDCQNAPLDCGPEEEQFRLIMMLKRPVVPIMNFVGNHIKEGKANAEAWRRMFESVGNHDALFIDAWERDRHEERHLYDRLKHLFKDNPAKQYFIGYYQGRQSSLVPSWLARGSDAVASWLIDCAAFEARRKWTPVINRKEISPELQLEVYETVSQISAERLEYLCKKMTQPNVDVPAVKLGQCESLEHEVESKVSDNPFVGKAPKGAKHRVMEKLASGKGLSRFLFSYNVFRKYGATMGKGAAIGTVAGVAVDIFTPTIGTATLLGTITGTAMGALLAKGSEVVFNRRDRSVSAFLNKEGLGNVTGVSLALLDHLYRRGVANTAPITERTLRHVEPKKIRGVVAKLENKIKPLRWKTKEKWCSIAAMHKDDSESGYKEPAARARFRKELAAHISEVIQEMKGPRITDDRSTLSEAADKIHSNYKRGAAYLREVISNSK